MNKIFNLSISLAIICQFLSSNAEKIDFNTNTDLYCEIFQNNNFKGESVRIFLNNEIRSLRSLRSFWNPVVENSRTLSFQLPANLEDEEEKECSLSLYACNLDDFKGNCTNFKMARKRIRYSRLSSIKCKCNEIKKISSDYHNHKKSTSQTQEGVRQLEYCKNLSVDKMRNFVKNGKKIIGIGRNYRWENSEFIKSLSIPSKPIVFLKPTSSYLLEGTPIKLINSLGTIFYEIELGVVIGKTARNVTQNSAYDYVAGYVLAFDMTAKDYLKNAIATGQPWEIGKGFDGGCPVGEFIPKSCIKNPNDMEIRALVNGKITQNNNTNGMIFKIPELISYVSQFMTLEENDLILTGTPDNFGAVKSGDTIEGILKNKEITAHIKFKVE